MRKFSGIHFYAPPDESMVIRVPAPEQLDYDTTELAHKFHREFLAKPEGFGGNIALPYHIPIEFRWCPLTETSGFALWRTSNEIRAASCILVGVETADDQHVFSAGLASHGLKITPPIFSSMMEEERPLMTTIHFDLRSIGDSVLATVAPVLAAAFIAMFE